METFLSYIGSFASIGGIPLAIYLYLKSREDKVDKIRRQILQIISYQIGENRDLNVFEIEKVINSNIRNNKLSSYSITIENILEDLISDTISSPLLNSERKDEIMINLKDIFPQEQENAEVKTVPQTRRSTIFAFVVLLSSMFPIALVSVLGESGWSEKAEWWLTFNTVQGYIGNLVFSVLTAVFGLITSYFIIMRTHNKQQRTGKTVT